MPAFATVRRGLAAGCSTYVGAPNSARRRPQLRARRVPRERDDIANAAIIHFSAAREQLSEVQAQLRKIPGHKQPKALNRLEKALEDCRRDRNTEPTLEAIERHLDALRGGLSELRRLQTDLSEDAVKQVTAGLSFRDVFLDQLSADVSEGHIEAAQVNAAATSLRECLDSPQPWECTAALTQSVGQLTAVYRQRRAAILSQQQARIEDALEHLKLRDGFDVLSQDDQYRVLEHVRSGARFDTTEQAPAPALSELQLQFPAHLQAAIDKALLELDSLRESKGEKPTVNVTVKLSGRDLETEDGLERLLDELRQQVLVEVRAGRRVRLK